MPEVFALCASLVWGSSDFAGGTLSRRVPSLAVVFLGMLLAVVGLAGGLLFADVTWSASMLWGAAAGVSGAIALVAFYRAMAAGPMSVVAPLSATGAVVPVVWAVARGQSLEWLQVAGVVLAIGGVILACGPRTGGAHVAPSTVALGVVAAAGFGGYFVFFALAAEHGVYGTLFAQRVAGVLVLLPLVARGGGAVLREARAVGWPVRRVLLLLFTAFGDVGANGLYGFAARDAGEGIAVVAVLASLYPVATVVLARVVDGERLRGVQGAGVLAALGGVVLLNV